MKRTPLFSTLGKLVACLTVFSSHLIFMPHAHALNLDGGGHYSILGTTQTSPAFSTSRGIYQAAEQYFNLTGEARFSDRSSFFMEFSLFDNPSYLGDAPRPSDHCLKEKGSEGGPCIQDGGRPGYEKYVPQVSKAFVRYAFDYCILEAGRRGRDWGLGMFLDSGDGLYDTEQSIYDGFTCKVNIQKNQVLGFSVGYDKLAETGNYIETPQASDVSGRPDRFGATNQSDDMDQYFLTIEYDDRVSNAGSPFTKNIGLYFANAMQPLTNTDLKFLDVYTGFYFYGLAFRNELLIRMAKSGDPNWKLIGGKGKEAEIQASNNLQSIALAGELEWNFLQSGAHVGPAEFNEGNASSHAVFLDYAYAPGDSDGYYAADDSKRDTKATAVAFHRNYKPALLIFNGRGDLRDLNVDGVFDPNRVMNATVFGAGYRYKSIQNGKFELKLITAQLNQGIPGDVKAQLQSELQSLSAEQKSGKALPVGYYGKALGYELDLKYSYLIGRELEINAAVAAGLPGKAWQIREGEKTATSYLLQLGTAFKF